MLVSFLVQTKGADGAVEDHVVQHVEDAIAVARAFVGFARGAAAVEALLEFDEP